MSLNIFGRSASDLEALQRIWTDAVRDDDPEDAIGALNEWRKTQPNFPAPCDVRPLIDERAKRRLESRPKIAAIPEGKHGRDSRTFDERVAAAAKIHDDMAALFREVGRKMSAPRSEWVIGHLSASVRTDCYLRRITNAEAAEFHVRIAELAKRCKVGAGAEVNQADETASLAAAIGCR